jgi:hypothetical protein
VKMDVVARPQHILRLPGISLKTYKPIEDVFDDRILSKFESADSTMITYDKIPVAFNGLHSWLKQVNVKCIICDRLFKEVPKFYPKDFTKDNSGNIEFSPIIGFMCSFACVRSYVDTLNLKRDELFNALDRLYFMYQIFTGEDINNILHSPNKTEREEYGGTWDMEKFIVELKKVDKWIDLNYKILDRMRNNTSLNTIITNCVLTGQLNNTPAQPVESDEVNKIEWNKAMNKKFDETLVIYD